MKTKKMTEDDLLSYLGRLEDKSEDYSEQLAAKRQTEVNAYNRGPYAGDEDLDGESDHVTSDFFNAVETLLPDIIDVFQSTDAICEFQPRRASDAQGADRATKGVNYVYSVQNKSFLLTYTAVKNALMHAMGSFYWHKQEEVDVQTEFYSGVPKIAFAEIEAIETEEGGTHKIIGAELIGMNGPVEMYDIEVEVTTEKEVIVIEALSPDELLIHPTHGSPDLDDCRYVCIKRVHTLSEIREMGFPNVTVDDMVETDEIIYPSELQATDETETFLVDGNEEMESSDPTQTEAYLRTEFVLVDADGDGIAERRRIIRLDGKILSDEIFDQVPISMASPILRQHMWKGQSLYDVVEDIQRLKTEVVREIRNSLGYANAPRTLAMRDEQGNTYGNQYDLADVRYGGVVRIDPNPFGTAAVGQMQHQFVGAHAYPFLESVQGEGESRLGVTRFNQGLDADSLNKTARGIMAIMSASQRKIKLIARIFAELLFKPMSIGVLKLMADGPMKPIMARIDDEYLTLDPSEFRKDYDLIVNVGLGTGNKQEQTAMLQGMIDSALQMQGTPIGDQITTPERIYRMYAELTENGGWKQPERFWLNPESTEAKQRDEQRQAEMAANPPPTPPEIQMKEAELKLKEQETVAQLQMKDRELKLRGAELANARQMKLDEQEFELRKMRQEGRSAALTERIRQTAETNRRILMLDTDVKKAREAIDAAKAAADKKESQTTETTD